MAWEESGASDERLKFIAQLLSGERMGLLPTSVDQNQYMNRT
jgi:hypothetical protein